MIDEHGGAQIDEKAALSCSAADAGKVEEMEALFQEKQISSGLSAAQLLAPLFGHSRTAQSDFLPPRFLRTKRDGSAARQEDAGARRAAPLLRWTSHMQSLAHLWHSAHHWQAHIV